MIYTNLKNWTKEFLRNIKCNYLIIIGYMIILAIIILFHIRSGVFTHNVQSVADAFIYVSAYWFFGIEIMILANFMLFNIIKDDLRINSIIKQKSRTLLWIKQVYKISLLSIFSSIWISLCTYFFGGLMTTHFINWNNVNSIYFKINKTVCSSISLKYVITMFLLCSFIRIVLIVTISLLIYWITNKKIISWLFVVTLGFLEISVPIVCKVINIDYTAINSIYKLIIGFSYGIVLILIAIILGVILGKRKEFYYE